MANADAWNLGWQAGQEAALHRRDRKEMFSDEDRQIRVNDLLSKRKQLADNIAQLTSTKSALVGPDRDHAEAGIKNLQTELDKVNIGIGEIYHPERNPGALAKDWDKIKHWFFGTKPPAPVLSRTQAQPGTQPGAVTLPGQDVTFPGTSVPRIKEELRPGDQGPTQADIPATTTTTPPTVSTGPQTVAMPGTAPDQTLSVIRAAMTPQQRDHAARLDAARRQTELDIAAAGLSPNQKAAAQSAEEWAYIRATQRNWEAANPTATPEQKVQFFNDLVGKVTGIAQKPSLKLYTLPDGTKAWLDASRPELIPPGATAIGAESADARAREDFSEAVKNGYRGSFEQWKVEQAQLGRLAVPTNRDDRYIQLEQRKILGQQLSPDDQAYMAAWDLYVKNRIVDPAVARAAAFANNRYVQVMDPNDPEKVIFMKAEEAAKAGLGTPASIGFQIDKAVTRYFTSGLGATNLNYFNTAVDHLKLLNEAADALNNGNYQLVNQWANSYAQATGDPAPTNFDTIKSAVAGELSKTFKGTGATDQEISEINGAINRSESPAQLHGAINYYVRLMGGKVNALRTQFNAAKQGKPAFPEDNTPGEFIYITNPLDSTHKVFKATKGATIPPGWVVTNAPK